MKFRERIAAFMYGRYGVDALSKCMLIVYIALAAVMLFIRNAVVYYILQGLSLALCILIFYRMFSRNITKRTAEYTRYLKIKKGIKE